VLIAILAFFGVIPDNVGDWTQDNIARGLQDFIICIEMFILSVAHIWVFSYDVYEEDHTDWYHNSPKKAIFSTPVKNFAVDVMNPTDVVKDIKKAYHPKHIKHAKKEHKRVKGEFKLKQKQTQVQEGDVLVQKKEIDIDVKIDVTGESQPQEDVYQKEETHEEESLPDESTTKSDSE